MIIKNLENSFVFTPKAILTVNDNLDKLLITNFDNKTHTIQSGQKVAIGKILPEAELFSLSSSKTQNIDTKEIINCFKGNSSIKEDFIKVIKMI